MDTNELANLLVEHDYMRLARLNTEENSIEKIVDYTIGYFSDPRRRSANNPEYAAYAQTIHSTPREQLIEAYQRALQIWSGKG